jgi:hypothetical protein
VQKATGFIAGGIGAGGFGRWQFDLGGEHGVQLLGRYVGAGRRPHVLSLRSGTRRRGGSTGRPPSGVGSGGTTGGTVAPLLVSLEHQNPATLAWTDDDDVALRYRLTDSATGALYGNVR